MTLGRLFFRIFPKSPIPATPKKILIFTLTGIGDMLMLTPAMRGLRKKYPDAKIDVMAYPSSLPIIKYNPNINYVFLGGINFSTWLQIRKEKYDMAICYSMLSIPVFAFLCGIPYRRGIAINGNGFALTEAFVYTPEENNILFSNRAAGVTESMQMDWALPPKGCVTYPIVMVPDAGTNDIAKKKQWPVGNWIKLIEQINKPVTLLGLDKELGDMIKRNVSVECDNLMGRTSIEDFGQHIRVAKLVICNDSAAMHIASTFHVPCVAIFGPTDERFLTPPGVVAVHSSVHCRPCFYDDDKISECDNQVCLENVTVEQVYEAITPQLNTINIYTPASN